MRNLQELDPDDSKEPGWERESHGAWRWKNVSNLNTYQLFVIIINNQLSQLRLIKELKTK